MIDLFSVTINYFRLSWHFINVEPCVCYLLCLVSFTQHNVFEIIHVLICINSPFLFTAKQYPSVLIFPTCLSIGQVGCCHFEAVKNKAAIYFYASFWVDICLCFYFSWEVPKCRILLGNIFLILYLKTVKLFFYRIHIIYIPLAMYETSSCSMFWPS